MAVDSPLQLIKHAKSNGNIGHLNHSEVCAFPAVDLEVSIDGFAQVHPQGSTSGANVILGTVVHSDGSFRESGPLCFGLCLVSDDRERAGLLKGNSTISG
jgi:hypothetical protein